MKKHYILLLASVLILGACASEPTSSSIAGSVSKTKSHKDVLLSHYEINFDVDSAVIGPDALGTVKKAAKDIKRQNASKVIVTGFADTAGDAKHNLALSKKRAKAAAKVLREEGVRSGLIERKAKGEEDTAYSTQDDVKFKENRRVTIQVYK